MFTHVKTIPQTTLNARNYADRCDVVFVRNDGVPYIKSNKRKDIFNGCTIYCWSTYLPNLFNYLNNSNTTDIILISGDNDHSVSTHGGYNKFSYIPPVPKNIKKWYAQNAETIDEIMTPLPIGLVPPWRSEASETEHLKQFTITDNRDKFVYSNFNIETNPEERTKIKQIISDRLNIKTVYNDVSDYYKALQTHKFIICPPGNGKDTHRVWESLYFGAIPVVEASAMNSYYAKNFPIILIDDWSNISYELLELEYSKLKQNYNYNLLDVDNWFKYHGIKND